MFFFKCGLPASHQSAMVGGWANTDSRTGRSHHGTAGDQWSLRTRMHLPPTATHRIHMMFDFSSGPPQERNHPPNRRPVPHSSTTSKLPPPAWALKAPHPASSHLTQPRTKDLASSALRLFGPRWSPLPGAAPHPDLRPRRRGGSHSRPRGRGRWDVCVGGSLR